MINFLMLNSISLIPHCSSNIEYHYCSISTRTTCYMSPIQMTWECLHSNLNKLTQSQIVFLNCGMFTPIGSQKGGFGKTFTLSFSMWETENSNAAIICHFCLCILATTNDGPCPIETSRPFPKSWIVTCKECHPNPAKFQIRTKFSPTESGWSGSAKTLFEYGLGFITQLQNEGGTFGITNCQVFLSNMFEFPSIITHSLASWQMSACTCLSCQQGHCISLSYCIERDILQYQCLLTWSTPGRVSFLFSPFKLKSTNCV